MNRRIPLLLISLLSLVTTLPAQLEVPSVFSDHAVLQQDLPLPIWGKGPPGAEVTVSFAGQTETSTVTANGRWRVTLNPLPASATPRTLTIASGDDRIEIDDVLVGEVWVCGGQSNMEWPIAASMNASEEIAAGDQPLIRCLSAPRRLSTVPEFDSGATWQVSSPKTVGQFTAVGTFFARELVRTQKVPVGLLSINWGGTRAEPWTERSALAEHSEFTEAVARFEARLRQWGNRDAAALDRDHAAAVERYEERMISYWDRLLAEDSGFLARYHEPECDESSFQSMPVPGVWRDHSSEFGGFDGVVWYRRTVAIPNEWAGRDLDLSLGAIDDADRVWFDGTLVGQTTHSWNTPRSYRVPASLVKPGLQTIAIAVLDTGGAGGMTGDAKGFRLDPVGSLRTPKSGLALWGNWRVAAGRAFDGQFGERRPTRPRSPAEDNRGPGLLFNAMLHPFIPYGIRGAIWYQGESNAGEPEKYRSLLPLMITNWRNAWVRENPTQGRFPFGIVQLASFRPASEDPNQGEWAFLRDAQRHAHQTTLKTGLVVTLDVGDAADIHPRNKQEVGRRLALWARATVHGESLEYSGPVFTGAVEPVAGSNDLRLKFNHASGLKTPRGSAATGFGVAAGDGRYHWVEATIDRQSVVLSHPEGKRIEHVRYAWSNNPTRANLRNEAGLPMEPFRWDRAKD